MSSPSAALPARGIGRTWLMAIALSIVVLAFVRALFDLVGRWSTQEEYSHGFLIPLITLWLLWARRHTVIASVGEPAWSGVFLILFALALHIVGLLSAIFVLSQIAFILTLLGVIWSAGGLSLLRATGIPILFLIFSIPLPYFVDAHLSLELQLISSRLGVTLIRLFQIPVYLEGNVIDLGTYKLQVVEACSGLRYLFPLASIAFLAALCFRGPMWQRTFVFLSSAPITVIMNGLRIGIVGLTVDRWGPQMADGILHALEGWILFVGSTSILALEILLFARFSGRRFSDAFSPAVVSPLARQQNWSRYVDRKPLYACAILVCVLAPLGALITSRPEAIPARSRFVTFPAVIGDWQGRVSSLDPQVQHDLALQDYILADYSKADRAGVNLYVAYYDSQRTGESPHSPLVCIPGNGWSITNFERVNYNLKHPFNRAIIERNGSRQLVYYWYEERGRAIANEYLSKWYLLIDALTKNRSDGALVRLVTGIARDEIERDADRRLQSFMATLLPALKGYLPGEMPIAPVDLSGASKL